MNFWKIEINGKAITNARYKEVKGFVSAIRPNTAIGNAMRVYQKEYPHIKHFSIKMDLVKLTNEEIYPGRGIHIG